MQHGVSIKEKAGQAAHFEATDAPRVPSQAAWRMGIDAIDDCLPHDGLSRAGLHEIEPLKASQWPTLTGFCFGLLSRLRPTQPIIWCVTAAQIGDYGQMYAFGLERYGISPAQIIFAKVSHALHLHFALEEALKTDGVAAVIGEGPRPDFTGSRRLSMLCRRHQRPCLLMSAERDGDHGSAAQTRFQVSSTASVEDPRDPYGPGLPTWYVGLPRVRLGKTMPPLTADIIHNKTTESQPNAAYPWRICWDDQTHCFRSPAVFSHRAAHQTEPETGPRGQTMVG